MAGTSAGVDAETSVPSDERIREIHESWAPNAEIFDRVFTHCQIVCRLAEELATRADLDVDVTLMRAGALVHDIGMYRLFSTPAGKGRDDYIRHGIMGYEILGEYGFPERIRRFCSRHTGSGLTREDVVAQELPLPVADYLAETDEERLVMYADKFHSKRRPPVFVSVATCLSRLGKFGDDTVARFESMRQRFGEPDLTALAGEYGYEVI